MSAIFTEFTRPGCEAEYSLLHGRAILSFESILTNFIQENFGIADIFPEGQILKMGKTAMKLLEMKDEEFYEGMGVYFVALATDLGYGLMLQSVGRRFRDFFVNLDNLHDYLKFTFQRMKAPSFFIADETPDGMLMEYRSKRRGFQYYVQGQVKEISKNFALEIKKLEIVLKKQEVGGSRQKVCIPLKLFSSS